MCVEGELEKDASQGLKGNDPGIRETCENQWEELGQTPWPLLTHVY